MNENLFNVLKQLALSVKRIIDENISKGTIKSEEFPFFRLKVDKFQYTDKGIIELSTHSEYIIKSLWFHATHELMKFIRESDKYSFTLEQLTKAFTENDKLSQALEYFLEKLIHEYLHTLKFEESNIDALIKTFLKDLREEPVKCGAKVELNGIVIVPSEIILSPGIILRQTKIEDLEKEFFAYGFTSLLSSIPPSAILNIEFLGRGANEIQKRIERSIAILRLFRVGSIKWIKYHMYSDSITNRAAHATLTSSIETTFETYSVTEEDVPKLKKFWQVINDAIPPSFFELGITKIDYLTVAYNRYSDCLFQNGILERRIANAVMGLEALFLKSNETQELIYRLSFRISKLLSLLGHDPYEVKKIVSDAYKIRNLFVHGGHLSYEKRRKIKSKYGDIRNFLRALLNYLRITIIVMMLSNREKDEFIDLIDNSFIDKRSEEMLNSIISKAKNIL